MTEITYLGYTEFDRERMWPEQHYSRRSDFARDRARVLHSSALRRLSAKTQVLSPTSGIDFARNRLTHSLEVAQVGREISAALKLDPDVVDTACLAHDLGHPPFGHNGETALNAWASDIGGFEGNAQSLRLLTRLEPKVVGSAGESYGLNLTRASLDATTKYPWGLASGELEANASRTKFGYYPEDSAVFDWMRQNAPERRRCIEAQVMDLSDDIAYSVHDFEDAIFSGFLDVKRLNSKTGHDELLVEVADWTGTSGETDELEQAFDRLLKLPDWLDHWDGSRRDQARLKNLTSEMIGSFVQQTIANTREYYAEGSLTRFSGSIVVPGEVWFEIAFLKGLVAATVMKLASRQPIYEQQRELLTELAELIYAKGDRELDPGFASDWRASKDEAVRKRIVVDQVSALTDQTALSWHERLSNNKSSIFV